MSFANKYIRKYGKLFSFAIVFLLIETACDLLLPTIMAKMIDVGIANGQMDKVKEYGGLMLLVTGIGAVTASIRNVVSSKVSQHFGKDLRSDMFKKIQSLSFKQIDQFDRASLITRLTNDVTQVQNFVNGMMRIYVKAPLLCIGSLIMAVRLNASLSVVLLIVVPLAIVFIALNMKIGFPYFLKVQTSLDRVNRVMREYLSGVRVVKAFNRFEYEVDKFEDANEQLAAKSVRSMRVVSIFSPSISLVVNMGIVGVLWLGGLGVNHGDIQVGHIVAFVNYMVQILFSLMMISNVFNMFVRARVSTGRVSEVLNIHNDMPYQGDNQESMRESGKIEFDKVSFSYGEGGSEPVVNNFSLTCLPGQTIGIIGSTGSGKSSLVHLIPRFYDVTSGTLKVNGRNVMDVEPSSLRDRIAIVPQQTVLFSGTVIDNLRFGLENATMEQMERAAKMAEAHEFIADLPEGYHSLIGQGGVNFSGGQKQRLSIARALIREPEILILDDCTSALDVATEAKIKQSLGKYAKGITCLLIAQRITSVMDSDQIVVMDQGRMVGIGSHEHLLDTCQVYQEIFQSQMGKEQI